MDTTRKGFLRILAVAALAALAPACGSGGGSGGGGQSTFDVSGGSAMGALAASVAGNSGSVAIFSCGDLRVGANPPPARPFLPNAPTTGTRVTSADLTAFDYTLASGNILLPGSIRSGDAAGQNLMITAANGDIVLSGHFQSGKNTTINPSPTRSLFLSAPNGTVYVTGSLRTHSDDELTDGTSSGEVQITAKRIVVTGTIDTSGERSTLPTTPGGNGGAITLVSGGGFDVLMVGASLASSGGDSGFTGGTPGNLVLTAGGAIHVHGSITGRGGTANNDASNMIGAPGAQVLTTSTTGFFMNAAIDLSGGDGISGGLGSTGGAGGEFRVDQPNTGPAALYGSMILRGGVASAGDRFATPSTGGAGGLVRIGDAGATTCPSAVDLPRAVILGLGGASNNTGGVGADVTLECRGAAPGSITFVGSVDIDGGSARVESGSAGSVTVQTMHGNISLEGEFLLRGADSPGTPSGGGALFVDCGGAAASPSGSLQFSATVDARGGRGRVTTVDGGAGGSLNLFARGPGETIQLDSKSSVLLDGGASSGTGIAGSGGTMLIETADGEIEILGLLTVRGGPAPEAGGTGGLGGTIRIHSDRDKSGTGGDVTIGKKAVLDASGGDGTIGGDAVSGLTVAIEIDADGDNSNSSVNNGIIRNLGAIIARGGAAGGFGGDALFDGLNPGGTAGPNPSETGGLLDLRSDGGPSGGFTSQ